MRSDAVRSIIAVCLVFLALGCGGPEERKAKYRLRAQEYIQEGNFPKARVALRNVLKIDPKDAEAYFLFAEVEEKEKNWSNAFANYQRVIELVPDHEGALIKLGKYYLEAKASDKALEMAKRVLAAHPGHVQAVALQIAVQALSGQLDEATRRAESLLADHPTEPDAALLLATLYTAHKRVRDVEPVLTPAIEAHPKDLDLLNALALAMVGMGDMARAEQTFKQIVEAEPKILDHRLRLAAFYDQQKQYDKAEAVLREVVRLDPDSDRRRLALVEFLVLRRGVQEGEAALLEAKRALPHAASISFALGKLYEMSQRPDKARLVYEEVRDSNRGRPVGLDATVRLAAFDWAEGKQAEAERQLEEVLKENPRSTEGLLLQGQIALQRGNGRDAVQVFRTVLKEQPDLADAYTLLGRAHALLGETNLARENFDKALAINPRLLDAQVALANLDIAEGRTKEARLRLEDLLKLDPGSVGGLGLLLALQVSERNWAATEQTLARLRAAGANTTAADLTEGDLLQARQEWEKARAAYERAAAASPEAPEPLVALVRLEIRQGKLPQAQSRLERVLAQHPKHPYALGLLGEVALLQGDAAGAKARFQQATRIKPDWATPWLTWATLELSEQQPVEARRILLAGLAANPRNEELRLLLASSLSEAGQVEPAIQEYETILKQNPRAVLAANNLAALLADQKGDPQSLERALMLSRDFETRAPHPYFLDTLGWVHLKMGHRHDAIRVMQQAVSRAPEHPVLNYHLGMAYYQAGQSNEARTHLQKAVRSGKAFAGADEARSVLSVLQG
jgi:tetratricopeptide (TPR) repeat protein